MKLMLLGIAIILFGIEYNYPTPIGFTCSIIGLVVSIIGCFIKDKK
jgi:hypothetical protein